MHKVISGLTDCVQKLLNVDNGIPVSASRIHVEFLPLFKSAIQIIKDGDADSWDELIEYIDTVFSVSIKLVYNSQIDPLDKEFVMFYLDSLSKIGARMRSTTNEYLNKMYIHQNELDGMTYTKEPKSK